MKLGTKELILIALVSMLDGRGGSYVISSLVKKYLNQNKKLSITKDLNDKTFKNTLARLKKDGLIEKTETGIWQITSYGKNWFAKFKNKNYHLDIPKSKNKNLIVIFDIPEKHRPKRDLLRAELVALGFEYLQKSVWFGAGPLPEKFIKFLRNLEILNNVHIFEIKSFGTLN